MDDTKMEVQEASCEPTVIVEAVDGATDNKNNSNNGGAAAATGLGAACACCLTCLGFFVGIPLMIGGGVLVSPWLGWISWALGLGIALILAGILMFAGAIVACVLTGCCAAKASQNNQQVAPAGVVVVQQAPAQPAAQPAAQNQQLMVSQPATVQQPLQPGQVEDPPAYEDPVYA